MTSTELPLWGIILTVGLGTFLLRLSFVHWFGGRETPPIVGQVLRHVPAAVLCALIVPAVLFRDGQAALSLGNERLLAALAAGVVAARTRNVVLTIVVGMGSLWALQSFLS